MGSACACCTETQRAALLYRPDVTSVVDWALKNPNDLSICSPLDFLEVSDVTDRVWVPNVARVFKHRQCIQSHTLPCDLVEKVLDSGFTGCALESRWK